jgi:fermentation-respiration switch protein FrsA (DUF1100 family)
MVVAAQDATAPVDLALGAYERAHEPKRLVILQGDHFDTYVPAFERASAAAEQWFVAHLNPGARRVF